MRLRKVGLIYVFQCTYGERQVASAAELWWHGYAAECERSFCSPCEYGVERCWWTFDDEKAWKLVQYAAPKAKARLEQMHRLKLNAAACEREISSWGDGTPLP